MLFKDCLSVFRRALFRSIIEFYQGKASQVLRHIFASHYMMNESDILKLQKLSGYSTIVTTMCYAHLAIHSLDDALGRRLLVSRRL